METWEDAPLYMTYKDMEGIYTPHYDPVIITSQFEIQRIKRILGDEGSGSSIMF